MVNVYTAETASGDIWCVVSRPGYGRDRFALDVTTWIRDEDGDMQPHELTLYEWGDEELAGVWLQGKQPPHGQRWPDLARAAKFGEMRYEYPGEFYFYNTKVQA